MGFYSCHLGFIVCWCGFLTALEIRVPMFWGDKVVYVYSSQVPGSFPSNQVPRRQQLSCAWALNGFPEVWCQTKFQAAVVLYLYSTCQVIMNMPKVELVPELCMCALPRFLEVFPSNQVARRQRLSCACALHGFLKVLCQTKFQAVVVLYLYYTYQVTGIGIT